MEDVRKAEFDELMNELFPKLNEAYEIAFKIFGKKFKDKEAADVGAWSFIALQAIKHSDKDASLGTILATLAAAINFSCNSISDQLNIDEKKEIMDRLIRQLAEGILGDNSNIMVKHHIEVKCDSQTKH